MNGVIRRRGMMVGSKKEYALTKKDQPVILAAFYNAGLCASPNYMTIEEAGAVTQQQFTNISFGSAVEDFSGFRYFTNVTGKSFQNYKITHIVFPSSFAGASNFAFASNPNLVTAVINPAFNPSGVFLFRGCSALKEIVWGSSMSTFKDYLINAGVESFICKSTIPPTLGSSVFSSVGTVYVPDSSVSDYQNAPGWSSYTIKGISEYQGDLIEYL